MNAAQVHVRNAPRFADRDAGRLARDLYGLSVAVEIVFP